MPPTPPEVKLGALDLNLLVVFDAVMQERNVTRAAQRLGLSQPAMSHALSRLRYMLKDDLFIRSPKGMLPTPRAEQLAAPVRTALDGLQQSLEPTQFDPSKAIRRFRIAVDNYSAVVLVGILAARIGEVAPKVLLEFQPSGTLKILDLLDRGELDLAIGPHSEPGERFSYQLLLRDEFIAVMRKNHSATSIGELAIEKFADLPHLEISSARHATDFIDEALAKRKREEWEAHHASEVAVWEASGYCKHTPHHTLGEQRECERQTEHEDWLAHKTERIAQWKRGEDVTLRTSYQDESMRYALLRVVQGDGAYVVETSMSVSVPVSGLAGAARLLRVLQSLRKAGKTYHTNGHKEHIGNFVVTSFALNADGEYVLIAGCHTIQWSEIETIIPQLIDAEALEAQQGLQA